MINEKEIIFDSDIDSLIDSILTIWNYSKPLMHTFKSDHKKYLYDTGTNKIFACEDAVFDILNNIESMGLHDGLLKSKQAIVFDEFRRGLNIIQNSILQNNVLKIYKANKFGLSTHYGDINKAIDTSLQMIQLEVTERCNLRCKYCVYNSFNTQKRNHGSKDMNISTAFKAIDYASECGKYQNEIGLGFYGGEPLLRIDFIKACIEYAKKKDNNKFRFNFTTNGTLITEKMAEYFASENIGIHVSLDGPEKIHDENRRDIANNGSFQNTIRGLKLLLDAYGNKGKKVSLSMVYMPPYSEEKIEEISELWNEYDWLPKEISLNITYPQGIYNLLKEENLYNNSVRDYSLFNWVKKKYLISYINGNKPHPIVANCLERNLAILMRRPTYNEPIDKFNLNGCCIPAVRKIFVTVDGNYAVCERIGSAPYIGDVNNGVRADIIKEIYIKDYDEKSLPICSKCWAIRLCQICYQNAFYSNEFNIGVKNQYCDAHRQITNDYLILFSSLLENNKDGLDYLLKWEFR